LQLLGVPVTGEHNRSFAPVNAVSGRAWTSARDAYLRALDLEQIARRTGIGREEARMRKEAAETTIQMLMGVG